MFLSAFLSCLCPLLDYKFTIAMIIFCHITTSDSTMIDSTLSSGGYCKSDGEMPVTLYYSLFVVIWVFGYATTQTSHLSMIPDLTTDKSTRMTLTSVRYSATVMSNVLVYFIAWLLLKTCKYYNPIK